MIKSRSAVAGRDFFYDQSERQSDEKKILGKGPSIILLGTLQVKNEVHKCGLFTRHTCGGYTKYNIAIVLSCTVLVFILCGESKNHREIIFYEGSVQYTRAVVDLLR